MAEALSANEAAVYDRQIRLWGVEAQRKLRASSVLVADMTPAVAEACKNMVLAGVGSVTLLDDKQTLSPSVLSSNFLAAIGKASLPQSDLDSKAESSPSVAETCVKALQELNPMVSVSTKPVSGLSEFTTLDLSGINVVLLGSPSLSVQKAVAAQCRACSPPVAFISLMTWGGRGRVVQDLIHYSWTIQPSPSAEASGSSANGGRGLKGQKQKTVEVTFPTFNEAVSVPLSRAPGNAPTLHFALRVLEEFESGRDGNGAEEKETKSSNTGDAESVAELRKFATERLSNVLATQGSSGPKKRRRQGGAITLVEEIVDIACGLLTASLQHSPEEPAGAAILGGFAAQDIIRYLSGTGIEVNNVLYFDFATLDASVVRLEGTS